MKPAIIFDMDGVIVHSEDLWVKYEPSYLTSLLGKTNAQKIGSTLGLAISQIFQKAIDLGYKGTKKEFYKGYDEIGIKLYSEANITPCMDVLIRKLHTEGFKLALVSSSPMHTIQTVLAKLKNADAFQYVESVNDHPTMRPKPAPDGYIAAMKSLSTEPNSTIIIEDSPSGVEAARASGAYVICFTKYLRNAPSKSANVYAKNISQLRSAIYLRGDSLKVTSQAQI